MTSPAFLGFFRILHFPPSSAFPGLTLEEVDRINRKLSQHRSQEVKQASDGAESRWCSYPQTQLASPGSTPAHS